MSDINDPNSISLPVGSSCTSRGASTETFTTSRSTTLFSSQQESKDEGNVELRESITLPTINHRVLLSLKESAKVIGTKGSTIQNVREINHVKIGLSEKQLGCSDRVLSCAGRIINVAHSLGQIVSVLKEGSTVSSAEKYAFHFLNPILPPPTRDEFQDLTLDEINKIGTSRLMVTNSQLSSIIGKGGARIKSLKERHRVKIVASRDFLPDSDERILEIQGLPNAITNVLLQISKILLNELDITFASERRYYPHLRSSSPSNAVSLAASTSGVQTGASNYLNNEFKATLKIPESYVGAIAGRRGNRIANLRKFTKTKIIVEKKIDKTVIDVDPDNRTFIILGDHFKNVKLAESMLLKNLDVEIEKRKSRLAKK
ncbi:hypothetical protein ZYGR_0AD03060 [Zygosaccharomyces rouxii]|uniref:Heterogeneous nuclear rnp K-like protein 2 n=2 Tax=Zygosaccharomyces rouxii TaxID=4956 RepID=HEK2_ZYGRC|nr:uncharacterized protein ZYRO0G13112g [Zygosaccharomyces rouxii]C5E0I9.1 RecName: Full=Heterogeneous nuclear rnp K-like protein 2; AltName: Full=KH domain-containing protein 1 [Zygosaccharomyces rouxii CBS 732]KAH9202616.1 heterogeneous nuclear rnp K-like protein 2 [Zygosaccharomyces rouxii]GAV51123.1 hypothetical protein ZYGR_0AD03060 [Zygosaccharomyces rouxii]CAR29623.1 ZYRO0G13112p [Zygosaccharomyces rouxii]